MNIKLKTLIIFGLLAGTAKAQAPDPAIAKVTYEFLHVNDLNHPEKVLKEEMELVLGENGSRYNRYAEFVKPAPITGGAVAAPMRVVSGGPVAIINGPGYTMGEFFQHPKTGEFNFTATLGMRDYLVPGKLPKINWKISQETKKIGDYNCQKATGTFAGREYTAWFTPDLPFSYGPWKLSGLPGLILEAYDAKREVQFLFKNISKDPDGENAGTRMARELITVDEKSFKRAQTAYDEDPVAGFQAQIPAGGPAVKMYVRDETGKLLKGDEAKAAFEQQKKDAKTMKVNPLELK